MDRNQTRVNHSGVIAAFVPGYSGGPVTDLHRFPLKSDWTTHSILFLDVILLPGSTVVKQNRIPTHRDIGLYPRLASSSPVTPLEKNSTGSIPAFTIISCTHQERYGYSVADEEQNPPWFQMVHPFSTVPRLSIEPVTGRDHPEKKLQCRHPSCRTSAQS